MEEEIIEQTKLFVHNQLTGEGSGHDWFHAQRVWKNAKKIHAAEKNGDLFIIELSALLHDLVDDKLVGSEEGYQKIEYFLEGEGLSQKVMDRVFEVISHISFSSGNSTSALSVEAQIVQDADRLDAMGAIGTARAFTYGGSKGQAIFDPAFSVRENMSKEEYRKGETSTIHHFYEKLLKLKDLMNTGSGRKMAEKRHHFMEDFLNEFFEEIDIS